MNPDVVGQETKLHGGHSLLIAEEVGYLQVKVVRVEDRVELIPYETVSSNNNNLYKGEVRIRVKGVPGEVRVSERITYINGARAGEPEEISRTHLKDPVTERREIGRKSTTITLNTGETVKVNPSVSGFTWPVPACHRISSPYGYRGRSFHKGIDIADGSTNGKIIVAAKDGVVELVQLGGSSYGNMILINHGNGVKTRYAHILTGSIAVRQGERVSIGQPIARVGSTGNSTGPHLHFEVLINGSTQNPRNYVSP
jgi:murein DD-endopeptidase MepM/ murein hydrolase activator NlpD